jgi:hypothetical protein
MSTLSSATVRQSHALPLYTTAVAWCFIAVCVAGGVYEALFGPRDMQPLLAALILFAGAALVVAGLLAARRGLAWLAVALVCAGSLLVGVVFFWTIVGVIVALALIVLFVMDARRGPSASRSRGAQAQ